MTPRSADPRSAPTARSVAATVLVRVFRDSAFAAAALDAELSRALQLEARDRGLATELVYGTLRTLPWLESKIDRYAKRGTRTLDAKTRADLLIGAYQLFFLDRVPAFAAVNEAVEAVRRIKGPKVAAFLNAVLRKLANDAAAVRDSAAVRKRTLEEAILFSVAPWIAEALLRALGDERDAFVLSGTCAPPIALRVEDPDTRNEWLERLRAAVPHATFEPGQVVAGAILVHGAGKPQSLPGYAEGALSIQEEGSQLVAASLGAGVGDDVLDACAGRGNKSACFARAGAVVDAADLYDEKLETLERELLRVGLAPRRTYAVDFRVGTGQLPSSYDRVLVDAPCSGIGTLRRRPDLQTRRAPDDLRELSALQAQILSCAAGLLKPGGALVYAVCSVLREEGEDVVTEFLRRCSHFEPCPLPGEPARSLAKEATHAKNETTLRLLPHVHGTDGYFLASFRRKC